MLSLSATGPLPGSSTARSNYCVAISGTTCAMVDFSCKSIWSGSMPVGQIACFNCGKTLLRLPSALPSSIRKLNVLGCVYACAVMTSP